MGNGHGREGEGEGEGEGEEEGRKSYINIGNATDYMITTPPPPRSQLPVAPLHKDDATLFHNNMCQTQTLWPGAVDCPPQKGIPIVITWNFGGNNVAVEGSWDNWTSRKILQRSGKDHAVLLVLPSGIYHYKFIVDGETRYTPDLPHLSSEMGDVCNVLNVHIHIIKKFTRFNEPFYEQDYKYTF